MSVPSFVAVSLLLLAFLPQAVRPETICHSPALGRNFSVGENWTEPTCSGMTCLQGGPKISLCLNGGLTPQFAANSGCVTKKGTPGAEYPKCCDEIDCPRPDQCYSSARNRTFNDGEEWTEPPCEHKQCKNGSILVTRCPRYPSVIGQDCVRTNGTPNADWPKCCDEVKCQRGDSCTSEALNRTFNDGETWSTEPSCDKRRCKKGATFVTHCPTYRGLKRLEQIGCFKTPSKSPTAAYPACCDQVTCPRNDQCYSKGLNKTFNDNETWTEPSCEYNECRNGTRFFKGCKKYTNLAGTGCVMKPGTPNASFPQCCEQLSCPCTSKSLNRTFQSGESWTEPNGTSCLFAECKDGTTYFKTCPIYSNYENRCFKTAGKPNASYPQCCEQLSCAGQRQCYSRALKKIFNNGQTWTDPPCHARKCINGNTGTARCPSPQQVGRLAHLGCISGNETPNAAFPRCCPGLDCPRPDQCYSRANNRRYNNGDEWYEAGCNYRVCRNGQTLGYSACG